MALTRTPRYGRGFDGFTVSPNPVQQGGYVRIKGAPGDVLYVLTPGGGRTKIELDEKGEAEIEAPVEGGKAFTITDFDPDDPHTVEVNVFTPLK